MALLVERGLVSYDEKVATYWPEFGQGDKGDITVADVMRHSGGCPWFMNPATVQPGEVKETWAAEDFIILSTADYGDAVKLDAMIEKNPRVQHGPDPRT